MQCAQKIIPYNQLEPWRKRLAASAEPLVVTNGCFDLLHPGHVMMLEAARALGASLLVGVTGDKGVRALKGNDRPAVPEQDRILMLAGLESVSFVSLFPDMDAVEFLTKARPAIYVKGGDYTLETINQRERQALVGMGAQIEIIPMFENRSSSALLERILKGKTGRL